MTSNDDNKEKYGMEYLKSNEGACLPSSLAASQPDTCKTSSK
jgi:hypothetical protein